MCLSFIRKFIERSVESDSVPFPKKLNGKQLGKQFIFSCFSRFLFFYFFVFSFLFFNIRCRISLRVLVCAKFKQIALIRFVYILVSIYQKLRNSRLYIEYEQKVGFTGSSLELSRSFEIK